MKKNFMSGIVGFCLLLMLASYAQAAGVKDSDTSRFSNAQTLYSTENAISGTEIKRCRVVRDETSKYPLIRIDETIVLKKNASAAEIVSRTEMVADHMIVKLKKGVSRKSLEDLCAPKAFSIRKQIKGSKDLYLVSFNVDQVNSLVLAIDGIKNDSDSVEYAEPDYILHANLTPDDPQFVDGTLWGMNKISGPAAWDIATGSRDIIVGVIDSGVDYNHVDIKDNIWTNTGEIPGNKIDDDNNGYIDDVHGWNAVDTTGDPMDDNGHGTHCSGTIGGVGNNGIGIVGVNWKVSIMALKFLDAFGRGWTSDAIICLNYATLMNADLTSNSWGGGAFDQSLKDAVDTNGKIFVAAAGNAGTDNDITPHYPSNYISANIISVAATDNSDVLADFSCYGATSVDLAAPGVSIYSSVPNNGYESWDGTSMATPHVAGAVALLLSTDPNLTAAQLKASIMNNTDAVEGLSGKCVTGGRLNVLKALVGDGSYSVSGTVSGAVQAGVTINLTGASSASTTTTAGGTYTLLGLVNGNYTVTPVLSGYTFNPTSLPVVISGANSTGKDFVASTSQQNVTLTYTAGANGTITGLSPQTLDYGADGTEVTAVPSTGYHFVDWSDGVLTAARTDKNVTGDLTVTANFANTYTVTFDLAGKGTRTGGGELSQAINYGSGATAPTVSGKFGWSFTGWDIDFSSITSNLTVTAQYSIKTNVVLTMEAIPEAGGSITPGAGEHTVNINEKVMITAEANTAKYAFLRWNATANAAIEDPKAANTNVVLMGDATVSAIFCDNSGDVFDGLSRVKITLNSTVDYKDMVLIMNAALPTLPASIQKDSVVTVSIDGITFDTSAGFKQGNQKVSFKGDTSKIDRFNLIFDLKNKRWQFMLSKASISKQGGINYTDGVDIFVTVDGFVFGQNIKMDLASTIWKYSSDINGPAQNLPVMGTQWPGYDITKAEGKRFMTKTDRDSFSVRQAVGNKISFDPANDLVIILIDNYVIALSAADEYVDGDNPWRTTGKGNYTFRGTFEDTTKLSLSLNLAQDNGTWMFKMSKAAFNLDVNDTDDIDVRVVLGDYEGRQSIHASWITTLAYPKK